MRAARLPTAILLTARGDRTASPAWTAWTVTIKPFAFDQLLARLRALSRHYAEGIRRHV
jgi:DNA-binding response OmpR family regulator